MTSKPAADHVAAHGAAHVAQADEGDAACRRIRAAVSHAAAAARGAPPPPRRARCRGPARRARARHPSASIRTGWASMKSRRSGVQPGGSYGYSRYGPPPTPQQTCRLASRPIPLVQVCGVNQRLRRSARSASVRAPEIPSASTTSGWNTSSASARARGAGPRTCAPSRRRRSACRSLSRSIRIPARSSPASGSSTHSTPCSDSASIAPARRLRPEAGCDVAGHPPPLVEVDHDLQGVADGVADRRHHRDALRDPVAGDADLDRAEAFVDQSHGIVGALRGRAQLAQRRVRRDAVDRAAQQRGHRRRRARPGQVPQGRLDRPVAPGVKRDRLERPRVGGQRERVAADEQVRERLEAVHRVAAADPGDALVGVDAHERGVKVACADPGPRRRGSGGRAAAAAARVRIAVIFTAPATSRAAVERAGDGVAAVDEGLHGLGIAPVPRAVARP